MGVATAAEVRWLTLGTWAAISQDQKAIGNCANLMQSLATAQTCVCWSQNTTATTIEEKGLLPLSPSESPSVYLMRRLSITTARVSVKVPPSHPSPPTGGMEWSKGGGRGSWVPSHYSFCGTPKTFPALETTKNEPTRESLGLIDLGNKLTVARQTRIGSLRWACTHNYIQNG